MWLDPFFPNKLAQDIAATCVTFIVSLLWLRLMDALAHRGFIAQQLSRKIIHIGTGPLFLLCWHLFSSQPWARFFAALVPLAITASAGTFYLGWICPRCLAADTEGSLLDVLGVYATREDADWNLLSEAYYASLEPPDPGLDAARP